MLPECIYISPSMHVPPYRWMLMIIGGHEFFCLFFCTESWSWCAKFKEAQWPIGYGVGLRIKRSSVSVRIRPWPLRWVLGQGSLLPLSQGEAFTLASISYLAILVKYILAKKKKEPAEWDIKTRHASTRRELHQMLQRSTALVALRLASWKHW